MKKSIIIVIIILIAKTGFSKDYTGAIEEGMGGASIGISALNGSLFSNPALYSFNFIYAVELLGFLQNSPSGYGARCSIIDTASSPVSGGLAFSYWEEKKEPEKGDKGPVKMDFVFNLAKSYRFIAGGINFKYHMLRKTKSDDAFLMDFGVGFKLFKEYLYIGAVGENIVQNGLRDEEVKRGIGGGIGGNLIGRILWDFDYIRREENNVYRGGIEFLFFNGTVGIRSGFSKDEETGKKFGAGISIYGPKIILNYGFSMLLDEPKTQSHILSFIFVPIR